MPDVYPQWHNYDQGILYRLGKDSCGSEAEQFVELLGQELNVDLFDIDPGFKVVHTPFSFLEAIGLTSIPNAMHDIMPFVLQDFKGILSEIKAGRRSVTELPMIVVKQYQQYFIGKSELAVSNLITQGERQIKEMPNPVIVELLRNTIQFAVNDLKNSVRLQQYHGVICHYLAIEYTQQFPYYDFLSNFYPDKKTRKCKTDEIYHGLFNGAADAILTKRNLSYFRTFDRARNIFAIQADGEARKVKQTFVDPYRTAGSHLKNNEDYQDSYLVHFAICGFFFEGQCHKTLNFTLDAPDVIRNRLIYGLQILHWINDCKGRPFQLNPGIVYCFDKFNLKIVDKIDVNKLKYTPIPHNQEKGTCS